jgi:Kdo2-lipid IVA lauroyltransferase/acyltransferase
MMTRFFLVLIRLVALLPLPVVRFLGSLLGLILYGVVGSRRRIVWSNLTLCFPHWSRSEVRRNARQVFKYFAQSWLDRGWLWHGSAQRLRSRLRVVGAVNELVGDEPTVIFAPHFFGLDAGWTALTQQISRSFTTIYTDQANKVADRWILRGRKRFGGARLFGRVEGVKPIIAGLKNGEPLYLLPDMNFGPHESLFVPFYGVPAATVPSLSRFARLGRAKVVPVISRMTGWGYEVEVLPAWKNFPTPNMQADTELMNLKLQTYIDQMPCQYYWVHKRFKDRPEGAAALY